jgi:hypothetical protein
MRAQPSSMLVRFRPKDKGSQQEAAAPGFGELSAPSCLPQMGEEASDFPA